MKNLLFIFLLLLFIPGLVFGASTTPTAQKLKVKAPPTKAVAKQRTIPKTVTKDIQRPVIKRAEITRLAIGTESNGIWYWEVTIKNTGNVELDGQRLVVQGYKIRYPQAQSTWTAASGSILGAGNLLPGQTRISKRQHWIRCCKTALLKVDLRDTTTNTILDTETSFSLTAVQGYPLGVRIQQIAWNDTSKTWQATVKNFTDFTLKVAVQGYIQQAGLLIPAGGSTITLRPFEESSAMWLHATSAQNGDRLKVHMKLLMGGNHCNDSNDDCGFKEFKYITIPNSQSF